MIARPSLSYLARGLQTGTLSVSRIATGQLLWSQRSAHQGAITHLVWSPDGEQLASCGQDGMVRIWRAVIGALLDVLEPREEVLRLRWSEHGVLVASCATVIHFWPLAPVAVASACEAGGQPEEPPSLSLVEARARRRERRLAWVREQCAGQPLQGILRHFQMAHLEDIRDEELAAVIKGIHRRQLRRTS